MKKLLVILIIGIFLVSANLAIAQPTVGFPMNSVFCGDIPTNNLVVPKNKEIYGYTFYPSDDTAWFVMIDGATTAGYGSSDIISEGGEANQYMMVTVWFPKPLITSRGCSVEQIDGYLTIYYQK